MSDPQLKSISFQTFSKEILPQVTASSKLLPEEELQKLKSEVFFRFFLQYSII